MHGLWRSPEDHRRPDRAALDPSLAGWGRATGPAPAEGASAGVRVRYLRSLTASCADRTAWPNDPARPQTIIRDFT